MKEILKRYKDLLNQKRYSQNTQDIYCSYFKDFYSYFRDKNLENITTAQINSYILYLIKSKNISISQQNQFKVHSRVVGGMKAQKQLKIYTHVFKKAIDKITNPIDEFFE